MLDNLTVKRLRGKQTCYTDEHADEICERLSLGETLASICRDPRMPPRTSVLEWVRRDRAGFADRYARARDRQLEHWADELIEIADDGRNDWMRRNECDNPGWQLNGEHVQRSRLRADTRKWLLSKLRPDKYGDRVENRTTINLADPIAELLGQIAAQGAMIYDPRPK